MFLRHKIVGSKYTFSLNTPHTLTEPLSHWTTEPLTDSFSCHTEVGWTYATLRVSQQLRVIGNQPLGRQLWRSVLLVSHKECVTQDHDTNISWTEWGEDWAEEKEKAEVEVEVEERSCECETHWLYQKHSVLEDHKEELVLLTVFVANLIHVSNRNRNGFYPTRRTQEEKVNELEGNSVWWHLGCESTETASQACKL